MIKKMFVSIFFIVITIISVDKTVNAAITEKQAQDVAEFAKKFIEEGNARRDEKGYPLLTYALSGNWNTCVEIRNSGYNEKLYYIKRNGYHIYKGRYVELGNKWCMDCGTYVTYMLKKTLGLELYNGKEPWHVQDIYNDALKGKKSKYLEFVYKSVSIRKIDYSKLQPGDIIARITSNGNHGMLYVGDGMIAHANRDMITYKGAAVFGFKVNKLNGYYLPGTVVSVIRIKDGIIPEDLEVNSSITWPDNGEIVDLLNRKTVVEEISGENIEMNSDINSEKSENIIPENTSDKLELSGEYFFEETMKLQEKRIEEVRTKFLMVHAYRMNESLFKWAK